MTIIYQTRVIAYRFADPNFRAGFVTVSIATVMFLEFAFVVFCLIATHR